MDLCKWQVRRGRKERALTTFQVNLRCPCHLLTIYDAGYQRGYQLEVDPYPNHISTRLNVWKCCDTPDHGLARDIMLF